MRLIRSIDLCRAHLLDSEKAELTQLQELVDKQSQSRNAHIGIGSGAGADSCFFGEASDGKTHMEDMEDVVEDEEEECVEEAVKVNKKRSLAEEPVDDSLLSVRDLRKQVKRECCPPPLHLNYYMRTKHS